MPNDLQHEVVVASLNLHAGLDRANVPFDVVAACASLSADILVLQEVWWPAGGASQAAAVAASLGYDHRWSSLGSGSCAPAGAQTHWARLVGTRLPAVRIDETLASERRCAPTDRGRFEWGRRGHLGIAVLSRLPILGSETLVFPRLQRDPTMRSALVVTVDLGTTTMEVIGTHMAHLSRGSLLHYAALRRTVGAAVGRRILVGDMNLWGPIVELLLPGWRRAVVGRSWPAHAPIAQPDHILTASGVTVVDGGVMPRVGSDHRPISARLVVCDHPDISGPGHGAGRRDGADLGGGAGFSGGEGTQRLRGSGS